jgi:hypothetical protein
MSINGWTVPLLKGTWFSFLVGSVIIIGIWGSISWRGMGEFPVKILGKEYRLLNVDLTVYAVTSCAILAIIHGFVG